MHKSVQDVQRFNRVSVALGLLSSSYMFQGGFKHSEPHLWIPQACIAVYSNYVASFITTMVWRKGFKLKGNVTRNLVNCMWEKSAKILYSLDLAQNLTMAAKEFLNFKFVTSK